MNTHNTLFIYKNQKLDIKTRDFKSFTTLDVKRDCDELSLVFRDKEHLKEFIDNVNTAYENIKNVEQEKQAKVF